MGQSTQKVRKIRSIERWPCLLLQINIPKLTLFGENFASSKNRKVFKFFIDILRGIPKKSKKVTCINFRVWAKFFVSQDELSKIAPKFGKFVTFSLAKVFKEN